ncbi:DgyrCDS5768 [Dimorphilus gyrociliatus]|uniref:DgyrCDS5768 n=1 Tax=Dimorphilus gyrociliatus TaxID=2664684 RepID=A0A7I8VMI6_9ANNE|nr:DgyrCDS5768 [Dimorphilus gyrociliatus]
MTEEECEYESLPTTNIVAHMVAGAGAGAMEHCIMYPIDCVKTRMQSLVPDPKASYKNVADALYTIIKQEGIGRTVRGINAVFFGAIPAHAMYFAAYEQIKLVLTERMSKQYHSVAHGLAGCSATIFHDAVMNPADVIKQRMQMYQSPYSTCSECGKRVLMEEGPHAFYRSYMTQLTMNIPFHAIHFMVYEKAQDMINPDRKYSPITHIASGGAAGAIAAAVTTPLDVCKTLLNTQERCAYQNDGTISGLRQASSLIYKFGGLQGFFRGLTARVIYQIPATAISWSVYETFKFILATKKSARASPILAANESSGIR